MLFQRIIKVDINGVGKTLEYPELKIEFEGEFDNDNEPDEFIIMIYNLTQTTINKIVNESDISLQAGYQDDFGTITIGIIKDVKSYKKKADYITEILMNTDNKSWNDNIVNKTFNPPITAKQILERLIPSTSLETGIIQLTDNKVYKRGKTVRGRISDVIKQIAIETNTNLTIQDGKVNITTGQVTKGFLVNAKSGLISTPIKVDKKDSDVVCSFDILFNHNIKNKSLIKLESKTFNGQYEVVKAKFNKGFTITIEVKEV